MALRTHTVRYPPAQLRAQRRFNAVLGRAPRLRTDPWRVEAGQRLSAWLAVAADRAARPRLRRRGLGVGMAQAPGDPPVPLRVLRPRGPLRAVILDIHGGGWVLGGAALNDRLNVHLATHGFCVVSADYRLLSERRRIYVESAIDDCVTAALWTLDHLGRLGGRDLFLAGDSAGAHLAALTALALRDRRRLAAVRGCVFAYGVFDLSGAPGVRAAGPETLLFDGPAMRADLARLAPHRDEAALRAPDVSPIYADLTGLPPALFLAGEADPLADDSRLMAAAWGRASDADLILAPETPHGFLHFGGPAARGGRRAIRAWLDHRLSVDSTTL